MYTWKNQLQHNLPTPAQQKTRGGGQTDPQITSWWERPTIERPNKNQKPKTYTEPTETKPKISKIGRSRRLYTKSHRYSTKEDYAKNSGGQNRAT